MNKPLTIWGAERRLFFLAAVMGAATFNFFGSLLGGLLMFGGSFWWRAGPRSPTQQILRILLNSAKFRAHYDPAKCDSPQSTGDATVIKFKRILKDYEESGALNALVNIHAAIDDKRS